jgi:Arc/MetJ-type ribon-helix-helix transcriptional regulator
MPARKVRTTVDLSPDLLEAMDAVVQEGAAESRNDFLERAIRKQLADSSRAALDATAAANRQRTELLARKYGSEEFSAEDELRLGALTERVRQLVPQVTQSDWQSVEGVHARLGEIEDRTRRVRARYGLSG